MREGAFAPDFVLNFNWTTSWCETQYDAHWTVTHHEYNGASPIALSGRPIACITRCAPEGPSCNGFSNHFSCDSDHSEAPQNAVFMDIHVNLRDAPACYTPLYKTGAIFFDLTATADVNEPGATVSDASAHTHHQLSASIEMQQSMTGFGSCYEFQRQMGRQAAVDLADNLNAYLSQH